MLERAVSCAPVGTEFLVICTSQWEFLVRMLISAAVLVCLVPNAIAQCPASWVPAGGPDLVVGNVAFDSSRGSLVLLGRDMLSLLPLQAWEWNQLGFSVRSSSGPPARTSTAVAF